MRILITFILVLFIGQNAYATPQIPEIVEIDGESYRLFSNPLEPLLRHPEYVENLDKFRIKNGCSANWSGYISSWRIFEDKLFLDGIVVNPCLQDSARIELSEIIPGAHSIQHAYWFTGTLVIPIGEMIEYSHTGYLSRYEGYLVFEVVSGDIIKSYETTEQVHSSWELYDPNKP